MGWRRAGFRLDDGPPDETGFQMKYLRRGGGYYFNVGCSDLIVAGKIGLLQYSDIERFVAEGVRMKDGRVVEAELLVAATGYKNQQDVVRLYLGDEVADRIGPVWGFDEGGEERNMWRRTAQPGLWFTAGGLPQCGSTRSIWRCRSRRSRRACWMPAGGRWHVRWSCSRGKVAEGRGFFALPAPVGLLYSAARGRVVTAGRCLVRIGAAMRAD